MQLKLKMDPKFKEFIEMNASLLKNRGGQPYFNSAE